MFAGSSHLDASCPCARRARPVRSCIIANQLLLARELVIIDRIHLLRCAWYKGVVGERGCICPAVVCRHDIAITVSAAVGRSEPLSTLSCCMAKRSGECEVAVYTMNERMTGRAHSACASIMPCGAVPHIWRRRTSQLQ